ncbi:diaminopimelate epimerase [Sphingobium sp. H39-3-25]|uniref:diaminopimelate epimerase n=1 Tax=Sphingobium arseniciresistens TaxID=3030834 RepID=UPI0023B9301B|nr:diaminopimelate epimerase [Sphingobium arseniciresistens]
MGASTQQLDFTKMHGLGNDFVVIDTRDGFVPSADLCRHLSDRHRGVGCDLILGVAPPLMAGSIASYRIWTPDGLSSQQCGNGARCIAAWVVRAGIAVGSSFTLDSPSGTHAVAMLGPDLFRVALGVPSFSPQAIPMTGIDSEEDVYELAIGAFPRLRFATVFMGNPHAVIEVDDVARVPIAVIGPALRSAECLPASLNVGFVQVESASRIQLRVDEFGSGETLACGSGACAAAAVLMRRGRVARQVTVGLTGGDLDISWPGPTAEISMTGPAAFVFDGTLST